MHCANAVLHAVHSQSAAQVEEGIPPFTYRGVINGKAGKAAALPKFSDTLTLSQSEGADCAQPLALLPLNFFVRITPLYIVF